MPSAFINGHTMYFETRGEGPAVLCMSGWGTICHGRTSFLPHSLLEGPYRLIFFDHRGLGESDDDPAVPPSTDLYARDAAGLLDHLRIDRVHVVGVAGMGALIGQKLAINDHDRVASLAMFGAWSKVDHYLGDQLRLFDLLHEKLGFEAYQMCAALFCYTPEYYDAQHDRLTGPQGPWQMLKQRQRVHANFIKACLEHDTSADLGKIDQPVLIAVGGVEDLVTGDRVGRVMKAGIPHAEYVVIDGAPHAHQAFPAAHKRFSDVFGDFVRRQVSAHR